METNTSSAALGFFDADHYEGLKNTMLSKAASGDAEAAEDLQLLASMEGSFTNYVSAVNEFEIKTAISRAVDRGEDYQTLYAQQDLARHNAHEAAIVKVKMLNRLAKAYGIEAVFTGDETNRYQIGDFCGALTLYVFSHRTR